MNDIDNVRLKMKLDECIKLDKKYPFKDNFDAFHEGIGRSLTNEEVRIIIKGLLVRYYEVIDDFDLAALLSVLLCYKNINNVDKFLIELKKEVENEETNKTVH